MSSIKWSDYVKLDQVYHAEKMFKAGCRTEPEPEP